MILSHNFVVALGDTSRELPIVARVNHDFVRPVLFARYNQDIHAMRFSRRAVQPVTHLMAFLGSIKELARQEIPDAI
jgi:hypothetical protein